MLRLITENFFSHKCYVQINQFNFVLPGYIVLRIRITFCMEKAKKANERYKYRYQWLVGSFP